MYDSHTQSTDVCAFFFSSTFFQDNSKLALRVIKEHGFVDIFLIGLLWSNCDFALPRRKERIQMPL